MIIGIAGTKNSGKDTVANMILYINKVGITTANYGGWLTNRLSIDATQYHKITHFANPLKDCLSVIYRIPRECFDDRKYKDEVYWCFNERRFIEKKYLNNNYQEITIKDLDYQDLDYNIKFCKKLPVIKIRTLMQYFGTNVCRNHLGENIWVDSTILKANEINDTYRICIIPDVRFENEAKAIMSSPTGELIKIIRDNVKAEHSSENINFNTELIINNNSNLQSLFYKVLDVYSKIKKTYI